ncbi:Crp/Fnr family transcriptional regulator [Motiliproteus sp.]|uniref:Crp/Fnr family transcriptional regulator n=1 Tax=Motiliproteus sp. TaxID=1898955 RepID=UPI003BA96403
MKSLVGVEVLQQLGIDYVRDASTLGALSEQALNYLFRNGELIFLEKDDVLFRLGDGADCFHVVLQGSIRLVKPRRDGRIAHIRDYPFGHEIGFVAMIGLHGRIGNALANEPSCLLRVSYGLFDALHDELPNDFGILLLNLSREMSRRLRDADNRLADAGVDDWSVAH